MSYINSASSMIGPWVGAHALVVIITGLVVGLVGGYLLGKPKKKK